MTEPVEIELTWGEVYRAGEGALTRCVGNLKKRREHRYGSEQNGGLSWDQHLVGCLGEMAVAKHFNIYWRCGEFGVVDVGPYEVRSTDAGHKRLMLHEEDRDDCAFILAHVLADLLPVVRLVGWMQGRDAKRQDWWGEGNPARPNGRPAFWVPTIELMPVQVLSP